MSAAVSAVSSVVRSGAGGVAVFSFEVHSVRALGVGTCVAASQNGVTQFVVTPGWQITWNGPFLQLPDGSTSAQRFTESTICPDAVMCHERRWPSQNEDSPDGRKKLL